MHNQNLTSAKRTRVVNATAAGTTSVNGTVLDMQDFDSVVFEACFGALTGTQVTKLKAQAGNASDGSDMADLVGAVTNALADADGNKMLCLEVVRPSGNGTPFRYIRCVVVRGTANAVIDSVVAMQYSSRKQPVTHDASTVSDALVCIEPLTTSTNYTNTSVTPLNGSTRINNTQRSAS
jgi:hypothetical protein